MSLDVHLLGQRIGTLFPAGEDDYRFAYSPETVGWAGEAATLLSNSLPVCTEPFGPGASRCYVEGLLPRGPRRRRLARELGVDAGDGYGLLTRLGGDCAGAAVFVPPGEGLEGDPGATEWLTDEELEDLVAGIPNGAGGAGSESPVRFSLSGEHHKLAVVRDERGSRWGLPQPSSPSTHVIKPETGEHPDLVANEMYCTEVAHSAGLPVVEMEPLRVGAHQVIISTRFDRRRGSKPVRIHQEDFCQALGLPPRDQADDEGPGFTEACGLLRAIGRSEDVPRLLAAAIFNYIVGNGDAHGENFALLFGGDGQRLAPLYDLTSTLVYDAPVHAGMVIAEEYDSEHPSLIELARVSEESGYDFDAFRELAGETAAAVGECLQPVAERARAEGWHAEVIDEIAGLAAERAFGLGAEVAY
ncbi:MAG TPA: HipA domain-containing protein [Solirubrobacterales bacterium]